MHTMDDPLLSPVVQAARDELQNPRILSDRIAVGRALWRELVIGFAGQLGSLDLGFTQLAALYAVAGPEMLTVGDLAQLLGRSPSATSRLVDGLVRQGYVERAEEVVDRRQRVLTLTPAGGAVLAAVDHERADQFLAVVRPMPMAERALVAMGVAALANHAVTRRGGLRRGRARR
jgi:DNA-binding MarR family transcriptional regulator